MRHRRPLPMLILLWGLSLAPTSAAYAGPPYPSPTQPARPAPWAEIRIEWPADALLEELRRWPDLEILSARRDEPLRAVVPAPAVEELRRRGFQVEIVAADLEEFYSSRLAAGQFGAYHTLSEIRNTLDSLHLAHPDITTERFPISTTYEGREVWALRVSDNPLLEEGEPEILIDALHHAREPMSAEVLLHYLAYLCDNYGTDPVVTFLVDEREIWFLPLVNPDGYYYNEVNYPNGGGMWRKNRRPVLECFGVDLNRNYTYWWGGEGSSADPCDLLYRGPGPGSEPEVQGVMALMMGHEFDIYHTFHSYGEQVLIPWCYTGFHTPDDALFREVGAEMARYNGYEVGQPAEILPQGCSGTSIDYAYGEIGEKNRIFAFITEVGGDDFWPPAVLIEPVCADNLYGNLYLTQVAGSYLRVDDSWLGGDGRADPGETVDLFVTLRNHGVNEGVSPAELILRTQDSYLRLHTARVPYGDLSPRLERTNSNYPLVFEVDPACPPGHEALLTFELWGSDMTYPPDSLNLTLGIPPMVYYQSFETGSDWTTDPSHTASTGTFVRVDPNPTAYQPGDDTSEPGTYCLVTGQNVSLGIEDVDGGISAVRSPSIDLSMVPLATLKANYFFGQRDLGDDPAGDFFRLQLSNDGGATFPLTLLEIPDFSRGPEWAALEAELHDLLPLTSEMVIRIQASDGPGEGDIIEAGIDDVMILEGILNLAPSPPALLAPAVGDTVAPRTPRLWVANGHDADPGDTLIYFFEVYSDSLLTRLEASVSALPEGIDSTYWDVDPPLLRGVTHWWRAFVDDGTERSPAMPAGSFLVEPTAGVAEGTEEPEVAGPLALTVGGPNPAPARASRLSFRLPRAGVVDLAVYDVRGRLVRRLLRERRESGEGRAEWDGRDERGRPVASGVYLVRLALGSESLSRKITLIR